MAQPLVLSRAQLEMARLIIARLRAQAAGDPFIPAELGVAFVDGDPAVGITDENVIITAGDTLYASLVIVWTVINHCTSQDSDGIAEMISQLGLMFASVEPRDLP